MFKNSKGLTAFELKIIGAVSMLIDHIKVILYTPLIDAKGIVDYFSDPLYLVMHFLGRIAFPIFAFLLVEGAIRTSNRKKYGIRLLAFAIISQIPYSLAFTGKMFSFEKLNVLFTLFLGLIVIIFLDKIKEKTEVKTWAPVYTIIIAAVSSAISYFLKMEYAIIGPLMMIAFYCFRDRRQMWLALDTALFIIFEQIPAVLSFPFIYGYNGLKGREVNKYWFYGFYPIHMLILFSLIYFQLK